MEKKISQEDKIFQYLMDHDGITQKDAIREFECYRLSGRIFDLRAQGIKIITEMRHNKETGSNYAFYRLGENEFYTVG